MYVLIRDFADDQIHLIHVNEMGYNNETECMWIESHSANSRDIPVSEEDYEIIVRKLFEVGKLDLSNTDLRAFYDDDNHEEYFDEE